MTPTALTIVLRSCDCIAQTLRSVDERVLTHRRGQSLIMPDGALLFARRQSIQKGLLTALPNRYLSGAAARFTPAAAESRGAVR